jgi:hypothetical protein
MEKPKLLQERVGKAKVNYKHLYQCPRCPNTFISYKFNVDSGHTSSCGCYHKQRAKETNTIHGQSRIGGWSSKTNSPEYASWAAMRARCLNPKHRGYKFYGEKGVTIHPEWIDSFDAFRAYMGPRPEGTSLDRKDPEGNYVPGNVRWADKKTQQDNTRAAKKRAQAKQS